jgi:multimeric flavodoxin WrbA
MKFLILMGSPRKNGNTAQCVEAFCQELKGQGQDYDLVWLYDKEIEPCHACRFCQQDWSKFTCAINDDAFELADKILASDVIVLATPIYSWYCTAPMKALLDRMVYGLNMYYGDKRGPSLWAGKNLAIITTCGYRPEKGADLFAEGMRRYCKHSQLNYAGMMVERHLGYNTVFMDDEKAAHAREFAKKLMYQK